MVNWKTAATSRNPMSMLSRPGPQRHRRTRQRPTTSTVRVLNWNRADAFAQSGYLRLLEAEPGSPIEIQPNFLSEPEDVSDLVDAVETAMELVGTTAYADWFDGYAAPERRLNRADTVRFIRIACSTFFHTCGTAKMGSDDMSVVDERLAVPRPRGPAHRGCLRDPDHSDLQYPRARHHDR